MVVRFMTWITTLLFYLPYWFVRRAWPMLLLLGVGMIAGIVLTCAVPLLTYTSLTASLQHALSQPYRNDVVITDDITQFSSGDVDAVSSQIDATIRSTLSSYLSPQVDLALRSQDFAFSVAGVHPRSAVIHFKTFPTPYLAGQFPIIAGRLPNEHADDEIVVSQQTAQAMSVQVGSTVSITSINIPGQPMRFPPVSFHVVGIVTSATGDIADPLNIEPIDPLQSGQQNSYSALMFNTAFLHTFDMLSQALVPSEKLDIQVMWVYYVAIDQVTEQNFSVIQDRLQKLTPLVSDQIYFHKGMTGQAYGNALLTLQDYKGRIQNTQIPLAAILIQMLVVVFWFVTTIAELLIERQKDAIALLRSRGASIAPLMSAIFVPSVAISAISILAGPPLAIAITASATHLSGSSLDTPSVLSSLTRHWVHLSSTLIWYSIGIAGTLLSALAFALFRTLNRNILTARQEAARSSERHFWQKWHLDIIAAFVSLGFYLSYVYYISSLANPDIYAALAPFSIYAPICLMISGAMLIARFLPWVVERGTLLTARFRGVVPLLLNTQLVQARQRMLRVPLFFALAIALVAFVLIYHASLIQHNDDYAAFQVGADFSGTLPITTTQTISFQQQQSLFQEIPGVQAVSLGSIIDIQPSDSAQQSTSSLRLLAVDSSTFGGAGTWPDQSGPSLSQVMDQLTQLRTSAPSQDIVPAIVDDAMWQSLHLASGMQFALDLSGKGSLILHFMAVQRVAHIPMIDDFPGYTASNITGGLLVDFSTLTTIIHQQYPEQSTPPGYVWLRTSHDQTSISQIRKILHQSPYQLSGFQDRFQILENAQLDPLALALEGITGAGAVISVILAFITMLTIFWSTFQKRLLNLTTMYALGALRRQIMSILLLEDGVLLLLGIIIGILLSVQLAGVVVPLMTYAQASDIQQSFVALLVPPSRIVVPWQPILIGVGVFLLFCPVVTYLLARSTIRAKASKILRLNED